MRRVLISLERMLTRRTANTNALRELLDDCHCQRSNDGRTTSIDPLHVFTSTEM